MGDAGVSGWVVHAPHRHGLRASACIDVQHPDEDSNLAPTLCSALRPHARLRPRPPPTPQPGPRDAGAAARVCARGRVGGQVCGAALRVECGVVSERSSSDAAQAGQEAASCADQGRGSRIPLSRARLARASTPRERRGGREGGGSRARADAAGWARALRRGASRSRPSGDEAAAGPCRSAHARLQTSSPRCVLPCVPTPASGRGFHTAAGAARRRRRGPCPCAWTCGRASVRGGSARRVRRCVRAQLERRGAGRPRGGELCGPRAGVAHPAVTAARL